MLLLIPSFMDTVVDPLRLITSFLLFGPSVMLWESKEFHLRLTRRRNAMRQKESALLISVPQTPEITTHWTHPRKTEPERLLKLKKRPRPRCTHPSWLITTLPNTTTLSFSKPRQPLKLLTEQILVSIMKSSSIFPTLSIQVKSLPVSPSQDPLILETLLNTPMLFSITSPQDKDILKDG